LPDIPKILSPDELLWLREWLSEKQMLEGINSWISEGGSLPTEAQLGASRSVIFDVLEAARSRVEAGLPPYGNLWEEPSEEERRKSIEASKKRVGVLQGLKPNACGKRLTQAPLPSDQCPLARLEGGPGAARRSTRR
jgi:hypothetical protein